MTELTGVLHPAELARLRAMRITGRAGKMLTLAVVCSLTTATAIMVAALAGSL
jgi:hypothetical protein